MQESPPRVEVKLGQLGTLHIPVYSNTGGGRGGLYPSPHSLFYGESNQGSEKLHHLLKGP